MVADVQIAMKIDPTFEAPTPVAAFNDAAQAVVIDNPQAQMANNANAAPSASMSFREAASFEKTLIPEHGPQEATVTYNPELLQGCENTTTLPDVAPNMMANDSLLGALCSVGEEFREEISATAAKCGIETQASASRNVMEQQQATQHTYTQTYSCGSGPS